MAQVSGAIAARFIILESRGALLHASGQTAVPQSFQGGDVTGLESAGKLSAIRMKTCPVCANLAGGMRSFTGIIYHLPFQKSSPGAFASFMQNLQMSPPTGVGKNVAP